MDDAPDPIRQGQVSRAGSPGESFSGDRGRWAAFLSGTSIIVEVPALILAATGAGFGALAKDAGFSLGQATFMSAVIYATPAQVVLVDQMARGASLVVAAFAVMLTAIRLLPMSVSMMPYLRGPDTPRWQYVVASHFVAITGWSEAVRRLPGRPPEERMAMFFGLGGALALALVAGTIAGYLLAGAVPPILTSALLFMTPVYFLLSQIVNVRERIDGLAIAAGLILGPLFFIAAPGIDLLLSGLIGGTAAFIIARRSEGGTAG